MAIDRASAFGAALISEMRNSATGNADDLFALTDVSAELSVHLCRIIGSQDPEPAILVGLMRRLIEQYGDSRDPQLAKEIRRGRSAAYGRSYVMISAWVVAVMRKRADDSDVRGEWGSYIEWCWDATVLRYYLLWLSGAGLSARMGLPISIAAPANALLSLALAYCPAE